MYMYMYMCIYVYTHTNTLIHTSIELYVTASMIPRASFSAAFGRSIPPPRSGDEHSAEDLRLGEALITDGIGAPDTNPINLVTGVSTII